MIMREATVSLIPEFPLISVIFPGPGRRKAAVSLSGHGRQTPGISSRILLKTAQIREAAKYAGASNRSLDKHCVVQPPIMTDSNRQHGLILKVDRKWTIWQFFFSKSWNHF
jgi:hypothetical protein